jgi:hypothetical protein
MATPTSVCMSQYKIPPSYKLDKLIKIGKNLSTK